MKTLYYILFIGLLILLLLTSCKKQDEPTPETPDTEIKYHLNYQTGMKRYWITITGDYKNGDDFYFHRTYNNPIDTVVIVPKGKLIKSECELATINGQANVTITVYVNGTATEILTPDNSDKIYFKWQ